MPRTATEQTLRLCFGQFGLVTQALVRHDEEEVGIGFVTFGDPSVASRVLARSEAGLVQMGGKQIECNGLGETDPARRLEAHKTLERIGWALGTPKRRLGSLGGQYALIRPIHPKQPRLGPGWSARGTKLEPLGLGDADEGDLIGLALPSAGLTGLPEHDLDSGRPLISLS